MDFSLEHSSNNIYNSKTKEYFKEVKSSYENHNFRSVIVSLYSIVICDLVYKLQDLRDIFEDDSAGGILDEIQKNQKENPNSPDWESKLIELIKKRSSILDASTYENIKSLQKHRHLCAHPIMEQNFELYQPNQETAISHIRNIIEGLLMNPPLVSNKIFKILIEDIAENKGALRNNEELEKYLRARYFKYMVPQIKVLVFRSLWKISYFLENDDCNKNRSINARTLRLIFEDDKTTIQEAIKKDREYYSKLRNGSPMFFLVGLIAYHPQVYLLLNEDAQILIKAQIEKGKHKKAIAWFLAESLEEHINWMLQNERDFPKLNYSQILPLRKPCVEAGKLNLYFDLLIKLYSKSKTIDVWRYRYTILEKSIVEFPRDILIELISEINLSSFLTTKSFHKINDSIKKNAAEKLGDSFDFSVYDKFYKWIEKNEDDMQQSVN